MKKKEIEHFLIDRGLYGRIKIEDAKALEKMLAHKLELAIYKRWQKKFNNALESTIAPRINILRLKRNCDNYIQKITIANGNNKI
jgi:hypothetical protein